MENILRDMKRHTSEKLRDAIKSSDKESRKEWMLDLMRQAGEKNGNNRGFQSWRQDNHPIELSNLGVVQQKLDYIHFNPVEAGFVRRPEDYLYSSAIDYFTEMKGFINVIRLEPILMPNI